MVLRIEEAEAFDFKDGDELKLHSTLLECKSRNELPWIMEVNLTEVGIAERVGSDIEGGGDDDSLSCKIGTLVGVEDFVGKEGG